MSLTVQELDIANMVESELRDYAAGNTHVTAEQIVQSFKNAAIDLRKKVSQLPEDLWQVFHTFEQRPSGAVIDLTEVVKLLKPA